MRLADARLAAREERSDRGRDGNYYERTKAIRTKHLKFFPQGCKILDVGCAEGTLMKYMAERGYSVTEAFVESCYDIPLAGGVVTISKAVHPSRNRINSS